ncbi:amidohydrolase [Poseidonocella sp. HB161398]|uniref:amidohydrolase family protein n=1 Tax=Poseidonocella sp. HB161398 TaxID=2320855 RepID=UPI001109A8E2|nr:amidohydrolase family protein [Poseidonocella sp. HB161398]
MIIDAHHHFWQVDRGDYGWMTPDLTPLLRDFGPEDLAPLNTAAGVSGTILVQAAETEAETDFLLGIADRTHFVAGVVGWLDMTAPDFAARLDLYEAHPKWLGLRPMLQEHDPDLIGSPAFRNALAEVARRDTPFDILTFPRHLPAMLDALAGVPTLRGVVDHLSKPDMTAGDLGQWGIDIAALAAHPRLMCKVSGMVTEAGPGWSADRIRPYLRHVAEAFGPDRLIFGTDWPVCTLAATHGEVVDLARTLLGEVFEADDLAKVFGENARRFYKLA